MQAFTALEASSQACMDDLQVVWLQSGISHPQVEEELAKAGITVVADRCLKVDRQHAIMSRM